MGDLKDDWIEKHYLTDPTEEEESPKCPHGHDKAWDACCPYCTPDDDCVRTDDGIDDECPLEE